MVQKTIKQFVIVLANFIILISCNITQEIKEIQFSELFQNEIELSFPDSLGESVSMRSAVFIKDDIIAFSERYTKALYIMNLQSNMIKKISESGAGPSFLKVPSHLHLYKDTLLIGDLEKPYIQKRDLNGNFISELKIKTPIEFRKFIYNKYGYFILNYDIDLNYLNHNNNEYFPTQLVFKDAYPIPSSVDMIEQNNNILFMNSYEAFIHKFNIETKETVKIAIDGIKKYDWTQNYNNKLDYQELNKIRNQIFTNLQLYDFNDQFFLLNGYEENQNRIESNYFEEMISYFLVSHNGKIKYKINMDLNNKYIIVTKNKSKILFLKINPENRKMSFIMYNIKMFN